MQVAETTGCQARAVPAARITLKFSTGLVVLIPAPSGDWSRDPAWRCVDGSLPLNDVAVIRFPASRVSLPALAIASSEGITSLRNKGATLFGGGYYYAGGRWRLSSWIRKSSNGGFFQNPFCQYPGDICFRSTGSTSEHGDSGGPWVGWLGGSWKLIAVESGFYGAADSPNYHETLVNAGASMADSTVRSWVYQQIAPKTAYCSLRGGAEGGSALPFTATGISCAEASTIINAAVHDAGSCLVASAGCLVQQGFVCRSPGERYVSPGDRITCTEGDARIRFILPG